VEGLRSGLGLYRNINAAFERELERNTPRREIPVTLDVEISGKYNIGITATSEDGRTVVCPFNSDLETAENRERQEAMIREQLAKRSGHYAFRMGRLDVRTAGGSLPLMSASLLNGIRRLVASDLDAIPCKRIPMETGRRDPSVRVGARDLSYKYNVANGEARALYEERGAESVAPAYELAHPAGAELMRTRYCIRYELGMCPVHQGAKESRPLFLMNNGRRLALHFDCAKCEMTVTEDS
jgi:putative protease